MKSFLKWAVRHWKCVTGMIVSMIGIYIATTGEYQTGLNDSQAVVQAVEDERKKLGRTLTNKEMQNVVGKWIEKTYK